MVFSIHTSRMGAYVGQTYHCSDGRWWGRDFDVGVLRDGEAHDCGLRRAMKEFR